MNEFDVKKIVFSSSCTVYGDPEYLPVDENHPTGKCTNPYGKSKYFMEEIISEQCKANSVRILTTVDSGLYRGRGQLDPGQKRKT
jgi:UDP-glucose 4-epimerase